MTYCVAAKLSAGLVFLSDSRTNAGVDDISITKKMSIALIQQMESQVPKKKTSTLSKIFVQRMQMLVIKPSRLV